MSGFAGKATWSGLYPVSANDSDAAQFFILKCDTVTEPNLDGGEFHNGGGR